MVISFVNTLRRRVSMFTGEQTDLIAFFNQNKEKLVKEWENAIVINQGDPFKMKIRENGQALLDVILSMHTIAKQELLNIIEKIAIDVSEERVMADVNLGDFVYNVN